VNGFEVTRTVVLIPTFNERDTITATVNGVFSAAPYADVLVIDDLSPDGTGEIVEGHPRFGNGLQLLSRSDRSGLADAYRVAMTQVLLAGYQRIVQMDADGSHHGDELPQLRSACSSDDVLVLGTSTDFKGRKSIWADCLEL
jgi:dolichol-phosphate mannosyltransferase